MASVFAPNQHTAGFSTEDIDMDLGLLYIDALLIGLAVAVAGWVLSYAKSDVSIVDSFWSLFFILFAAVYAYGTEQVGLRSIVVLTLIAVWGLRLSLYITVRNHGKREDYRYQAMRAKGGPSFPVTSVYRIFGLQAFLAWLISIPLLLAIAGDRPLGILDYLGVTLWLVGFVFEAGGDFQLSRFLSNDDNKGRVMNRGFWKYTRHPNYFGDACIWWGFYLLALSAGGWWTIYAPIMMTLLLLNVSGVAMLEKTISDRRPKYAQYIRATNAFIPGRPKTVETDGD
jgi:steroid 5-alpha reductase family enzyme